jgi:hypothetical protein
MNCEDNCSCWYSQSLTINNLLQAVPDCKYRGHCKCFLVVITYMLSVLDCFLEIVFLLFSILSIADC